MSAPPFLDARTLSPAEVVDALEGALRAGLDPEADPPRLAALVRGAATAAEDRPRRFKSVGMAWQDAVVATAVHERRAAT